MRHLLDALRSLRREFGPRAERAKRARIAAAVRRVRAGRASAADLRAFHDELLFLSAYAESAAAARAANAALPIVGGAIAALSGAAREALADSGIAGTRLTTSFSLDLLAWLTARRGGRVALVWEDGTAGAALDEMLRLLVSSAEADGLLSERCTTQDWLRRANGAPARSEVDWLRERFAALPCPAALRDRLFESLDLRVAWSLPARGPSRTFTRFPPRPRFVHRDGLRREVRPAELLVTPLPRPQRLTRAGARRLIDVARETLAVRLRETDPVTYANPREVTLFCLERGVDVLLLGMQPERRLPIESFFGYVAAKNRVPIAYGGGWVFFERCEIGINLFDEFRGGESAYVFSQVLRVYQQHYRARLFTVDPFQFGADNQEAIASGAFWFYYRLGFRPREPALRTLADREAARIAARRDHRTRPALLRRLAGGHLELSIEGPRDTGGARSATSLRAAGAHRAGQQRGVEPPLELTDVGLTVTDWIARVHRGDREAAERAALSLAERALHLPPRGRRPDIELAWLRKLAPLAALLPDLPRWSDAARAALGAALLAKGGLRERDYALRLQDHARFRSELAQTVARRTRG
ncbi:MAG: hypothetical protein AB7Q17_14820 [Phycisphaerae bacterium]